MATYTKETFSESATGTPILIAATATAGTLIHQSAADSDIHEVWMWAANQHTSPLVLTVEFGGATAAYKIIVTIPAQEGLFQVIPGFPVVGAVAIRAFAGTTNLINVHGFVNTISA